MSARAVSARQPQAEALPRSMVLRTRGHTHGAVTRLVSPSDIGQLIKPFVFLDYFEADPADAPAFGFHPHSGIATLTLILSGQTSYKETTDREGVIETGGVEWMRASSGVWHAGGISGNERIKGFQLWLALYRVPVMATLGRFPKARESDSTWRTKEVRHVGSDTVTP